MTLLVVPAGVMLAAAVIIWLLNRKQVNIGGSWLTAVTAALLVWVRSLLLFRSPDRLFRIESLRSSMGADFPVLFSVDAISRPYMFTLAALLLLLLLTAPSGIDPQRAPYNWSLYLVLCAAGYISSASAGVWPLIFCWTIIDLIELFSRYMQNRPHRMERPILISMAFRMIGTLLAGISLAISVSDPAVTEETFISPKSGIVLLVACALRMGIIPLNQPYADRERTDIELGMTLRLVSIVSVMPILSRVPLEYLDPGLAVSLSLFVGFASLVGALGWVLSDSAASGYSYAAIAVTGMAFACTLRGQQASQILWGVSVILFCAPLALYDIHNRWMNLLLIGVILCFSGLPYTPDAAGWLGLVNEPISGMDILFIVVPMLVTGGAFIHVLRPGTKKFTELEPWMRTTYPLGFLMVIAAFILIMLFNRENMIVMMTEKDLVPILESDENIRLLEMRGLITAEQSELLTAGLLPDEKLRLLAPRELLNILSAENLSALLEAERHFDLGNIAGSCIAFAGALILGVFSEMLNRASSLKNLLLWVQEGINLFWRVTRTILSLEWLVKILGKAADLVRSVVETLSRILENSSGLAWELLLLALTAAAIFGNGAL